MNEPLNDDIFKRRGISLLWNIQSFQDSNFCDLKKIISLRKFFSHHQMRWTKVEKELSKSKALVVAGLESCIFSMEPNDAESFLSNILYKSIISFQNEFAGGGNNAALILWIAESSRIDYQPFLNRVLFSNNISLGKCLFRGAESDLREIQLRKDNKDITIGLFQQRIS